MAHFIRPSNNERISGQSIQLQAGSRFEVGLWGCEESPGVELVVAPAVFGSATATRGSKRATVRLWTILPAACGPIRIEARAAGGATWDWFELAVTERSAILDSQRQRVIQIATSMVGCHYLWGAAGASPGQQNGMRGRPGSVNLVTNRFDAANPCVHAASCSVDGYHVCAGRYRTAPGGRVARSTDTDLRTFLQQIAGQPPASWQSPSGLWPRMMEGKTVTKQIVWGESCVNVRHFDCVGLVNYCLSQALNRSIQDSIGGYNAHTRDVTRDPNVLPADILTRGTSHIGFAMGDGRVVHASESSRGVVIDPMGSWDRRGRFI